MFARKPSRRITENKMASHINVKSLSGSLCVILMLGLSHGVLAEGDKERGAYLADTCTGCHGIENYKNAYPTYYVPKLGGQNAGYIVAALTGYKNEERAHPTMRAQAASMTQQDMEDIAAFFASKGEVKTGDAVGPTPEAAKTLCQSCHGETGISIVDLYPNLAGQHSNYLNVALADYKSGKRSNVIMAAFVATLTEEQIEELSNYYSSQSGLYTLGN